jgi:hypothetical protein
LRSNWGPTNQSPNWSPPAPGTEISSAETGRQKPTQQLAVTNSETGRKRESPDFRARTARLLAKVQTLRLGGGRTRARTWDPMIKSHLLYQLSYAPGTCPEKPFTRGRRLAKRPPDVQQRNEISRGCFPLEIQPNFPQPPPRLGAAYPRSPNGGTGAGCRRRSPPLSRSGQTKSRRKPAAFQLSIRRR